MQIYNAFRIEIEIILGSNYQKSNIFLKLWKLMLDSTLIANGVCCHAVN